MPSADELWGLLTALALLGMAVELAIFLLNGCRAPEEQNDDDGEED